MTQRGVANDDVELIEKIGTEVEGGYVVLEKDFQALDRELKLLRDRARNLWASTWSFRAVEWSQRIMPHAAKSVGFCATPEIDLWSGEILTSMVRPTQFGTCCDPPPSQTLLPYQ